ncbi:dioxygenase [Paenibacillus sp. SYP-B3998]|uniref:Dioxygenase n=1 Tax=Paenibacillus sp. SYP-B3998 TaxID=2678564 RepID=A0A6G4A505_9BACL|nr:class III extradiol ring-cleavage dioxygenase [Paenibacillus sp. SYP-B3998]NEW09410.1 dioxygenase [Paenibacillus sp. SYP-B3998]
MLPSFYIAHGTPSLTAEQHAYTVFLQKFAKIIPKPNAIVLISAHWKHKVQQISSAFQLDMQCAISGFADELYAVKHSIRGDLALSLHLQQLFQAEGIQCELNDHQSMDRGAWGALHLMYPYSSVPVVVLSVNPKSTPEESYRIGAAIASLREKQVLVLGSGGTVYNLQRLDSNNPVPQEWAIEFEEWLAEQLETWNLEALFNYEVRAPNARIAVPTPEHFAPLLRALGAADTSHKAKLLHHSFRLGTLSLSCWMFGAKTK